ncbi:HTH-type transcriptional regulator PerR [compost metagenome]
MFTKIPLTALRAFEAAARLGGFKAAADELAVTPAAISYQIKTLEFRLKVLLFERTAQGVRLTEYGERLQAVVNRSLNEISRHLEEIQPVANSATLTISTTPAFSALWLIPRLGGFYERHPDIHVRIETSNELIDLLRESSTDVAIRCCFKDYPSLHQVPLLTERFCAYSSPGLMDRLQRKSPELINIQWGIPTPATINWKVWCKAAQQEDWFDMAVFRDYDDEHYALQGAVLGYGLVLASTVLAADSVDKGLLTPYRSDIQLPGARYLALCIPGRERHNPVKKFLDWIGQEAIRSQASSP